MLKKSIRMQIHVLFERKGFYITILILILFVTQNFLNNVFSLSNRDIVNMYAPYKLLLLSDMGKNFQLFTIYPFLIVLPAAFSYTADKGSREIDLICSKTGLKNYFYGKLIAAFFVTFLAFTLPMILDYFLNLISFPLNANGDKVNYSFFQAASITQTERYFLAKLYLSFPYLHAFISILFWGCLSGVFGVFVTSFSFFAYKYKLTLFLPFYFVYNITYLLNNKFHFYTGLNEYLTLHNGSDKCYFYLGGLLIFILLFIALVTYFKIKGEQLE